MTFEAKTILVADDEPHIARVAELKLSLAGFNVIKAHDGQQAWNTISNHSIDLLVTDYQMPKLSGLDLAKRMARTPETVDIPIILLTGQDYILKSDDVKKTSIARILSKPFSPRELLAVITAEFKKQLTEVWQ